MPDFSQEFATTVAAILRRNGKLCLDLREEWRRTEAADGRDIKLLADTQLESRLLAELQAHYSIPVLSEEAGWAGQAPAQDAPYWVIDPLDGSYNFQRGQSAFCIAVAVCRGSTPVFGAIYDISNDVCYTGGEGLPARENEHAISVADTPDPAHACLMTGLPIGGKFDPQAMGRFGADLADWKKVRMIGSAALSLAHVASGRADFYEEDGIFWWDVAAGLAIVKAAGGAYSIASLASDDGLRKAPLKIMAGNSALIAARQSKREADNG